MSIFKDLWWFFKLEKRAYIAGVGLLLIVALLELIPPKAVGYVVDGIQNGTLTLSKLWKVLLFLSIGALLTYTARYIWRIMIFGASVRLARKLRNQLFEHFTKMSPSFYQRKRVGDLMAHATNDLQAVQQTAGAGVLTLIDSIITGGFVLLTMGITISWKLTLISLIPMPFMALSTTYYGKILHKRFHKAQEAFSVLNNKVQENISGIKVIKTFGEESNEIEDFNNQSRDIVTKNIAVAKVDSLFDPTISLIVGLSFFLSLAFGSRMVIQNAMTLGDLISFTTYLGLLIWPMLAFGWLFNILERGRASYDRVSSLLAEQPDVVEQQGAIESSPKGSLDVTIQSFGYTEQQMVLKNISFHLEKGRTMGIIGKTGSGKTTLLKLLVREFGGYRGEILIAGRLIEEYSFNALRSSIGYVPQEHFLFSATIADNIAFAFPKATYENIRKAAETAQIHHDIQEFPYQYETMVGEKGVSLSGGQKQRVSIARAILLDPELLILDDSLSAVDAKTEEAILQSLKKNRQGKTTIITSHRLSAIQHADLIIVLNEGEIVQSGTHNELMEKEGWYHDMYVRQQLENQVELGG
ncbi:ABC transporter ATP-binding protein [Priestia abyssalis]|uniref:ABC transporter ATP-binding protein n=1 Tax=Priestia abyssalis TaxID=1221450 RepID=UPI0009957DAA|nr:ABC transporter transmembrane domain-containing protein [Priestia abyssalis]